VAVPVGVLEPEVGLARIADAIPVQVGLPGIMDPRTVVARGPPVVVRVAALRTISRIDGRVEGTGIADVSQPVAVGIQQLFLRGVGARVDRRGKFSRIGPPVAVAVDSSAAFAQVSLSVVVTVALAPVGSTGAVVAEVAHAVSVGVDLERVGNLRTDVLGVADPVAIQVALEFRAGACVVVGLLGVGDISTTVAGVSESVAVQVSLRPIRKGRAVVAGVADAVGIGVFLLGIGRLRAVVRVSGYAVVIGIGPRRPTVGIPGPVEIRHVAVGGGGIDVAGVFPLADRDETASADAIASGRTIGVRLAGSLSRPAIAAETRREPRCEQKQRDGQPNWGARG
jgi:hypothetical protein